MTTPEEHAAGESQRLAAHAVFLAAAPELLREWIDDAGLFPPASLSMADAIDAHLATRTGPWASLVGRFLLPASRTEEFRETLGNSFSGGAVRLGFIGDRGAQQLADEERFLWEPAFEVDLLEVAVADNEPETVAETCRIVGRPRAQGFVELPRGPSWEVNLATNLLTIASAGHGAKFRLGGVTAAAFPTELEVATFIGAAVRADVAVKLTAGLHHAIRHTDLVTGFEHHGFLNVALAVAEPDDAVRWLAERDAEVIVQAIRAIDARLVRSRWTAFGSCSIAEPVQDLIALGLLEQP